MFLAKEELIKTLSGIQEASLADFLVYGFPASHGAKPRRIFVENLR